MSQIRMHYRLNGRIPEPVEDIHEWARTFEMSIDKRRVAENEVGPWWISTVFLGIDHSFSDEGPPILFETMVFRKDGTRGGDWSELDARRYATWDEAEAGHYDMVETWRHRALWQIQLGRLREWIARQLFRGRRWLSARRTSSGM